jgi:predicted GIY-YIG superfamily endonuclease
MPWFVYILICSDFSFYVGHTESPQKRVITHNKGRRPVYTSRRRPVELAYYEEMPSKAAAVQREKQIKKWSRAKKLALISGDSTTLKNLSHSRKRLSQEVD